jgi:hypothetical protein
MTMNKNPEAVKTCLELRNEDNRKDLAKFQENLAVNPAYAFEWADKPIAAAAHLSVFTQVIEAIDNDTPLDKIAKYAESQMRCAARYPSKSTSVCTNEVAQFKLAAWADVLEMIEGRLY